MKRIGILTYHRSINYGAFLQCYSLSSFIQKRYGDKVMVEVIDYETKEELLVRLKSIIKSHSIKDFFRKLKMFRGFWLDQEKFLNYSNKRIISNSKNALSRSISGQYDIIIVGSDAVWNVINSPAKSNFFLPGVVCDTKMSYAASTNGLNTSLLNDERKSFLDMCMKEFYYIGVREEKGVDFVKSISANLNVHRDCDPTCFINLSDFEDKIEEKFRKYSISTQRPIICLMTPNEHIGKIIYNHFHNDYQIISIYSYNKYSDIVLYDLRPSEFAVLFKHVKLLFSFFFHGSYLCLNNGTPVIAVDEDVEPDGMITKIEYLFKSLGLQDWYFNIKTFTSDDEKKLIETAKAILTEGDFSERILRSLHDERKNMLCFIDKLDKLIGA